MEFPINNTPTKRYIKIYQFQEQSSLMCAINRLHCTYTINWLHDRKTTTRQPIRNHRLLCKISEILKTAFPAYRNFFCKSLYFNVFNNMVVWWIKAKKVFVMLTTNLWKTSSLRPRAYGHTVILTRHSFEIFSVFGSLSYLFTYSVTNSFRTSCITIPSSLYG